MEGYSSVVIKYMIIYPKSQSQVTSILLFGTTFISLSKADVKLAVSICQTAISSFDTSIIFYDCDNYINIYLMIWRSPISRIIYSDRTVGL